MKHYVLGFVFNRYRDKVLLIEKKRPAWQAGHWNGIGGKIEDVVPRRYGRTFETPGEAMVRECLEETKLCELGIGACFEHAITMLCDGGTVFIYRVFCNEEDIPFMQVEDEVLKAWSVSELPEKMMVNCKWMIEICLANHIKYPVIVQQNGYGVE